MTTPLIIDYYTDVLCVWAWIAQKRIDELSQHFGDQIVFNHKYIDVFGSAHTKIETQWESRGGFDGFADHVQESASHYEDAIVHKNLWHDVRPQSSASPHLIIKAVELCYGQDIANDYALDIRKQFFIKGEDIADLNVLNPLFPAHNIDLQAILAVLNNGKAMAALMHDYQSAKQLALKGSPSYILSNGRQTLYGNVGYRVLRANIEELLKQPHDEASWC